MCSGFVEFQKLFFFFSFFLLKNKKNLSLFFKVWFVILWALFFVGHKDECTILQPLRTFFMPTDILVARVLVFFCEKAMATTGMLMANTSAC